MTITEKNVTASSIVRIKKYKEREMGNEKWEQLVLSNNNKCIKVFEQQDLFRPVFLIVTCNIKN